MQCPERAPEYEGGEQPRKFAVMGHDAGGGDFASTVIAFIKLSYRQLRNALVNSWLMEEAGGLSSSRTWPSASGQACYCAGNGETKSD